MTGDLVLAGAISFVILGLCCISKYCEESWVAPGSLLCTVWFFGSIIPILVSPDLPLYLEAYLSVLAFVAVGVLAAILSNVLCPLPKRACVSLSSKGFLLLDRVYWVSLFLGLGAPVLLYIDVTQHFGPTELMVMASKVTEARYKYEYEQGIIVSILSMCIFLASCVGGLADSHSKIQLDYAW